MRHAKVFQLAGQLTLVFLLALGGVRLLGPQLYAAIAAFTMVVCGAILIPIRERDGIGFVLQLAGVVLLLGACWPVLPIIIAGGARSRVVPYNPGSPKAPDRDRHTDGEA